MAVTTWADSIAETFSRYAVNKLLRLNGMSAVDGPHLTHGPLGTPDLNAMGQFLNNVGLGGFIKPDADLEQWLRDVADMPEIPPHELELRNQQEEQNVEQDGDKTAGKTGSNGQPLDRGQPQQPGDNVDGMTLKQQIEAFRAGAKNGNGHHNGKNDGNAKSSGLEKRVKARAKSARELMDKQAARRLKRLKNVPREEREQAAAKDAKKEE